MLWCRILCILGYAIHFHSFPWPNVEAQEYTFHHENVLGTSLEIRLRAHEETEACKAEKRILQEVDRLSLIYSHYDSSSEFSKFIQAEVGTPIVLSQELVEVLKRCDQWNEVSRGAFQPGVEGISRLWKQASESGDLPTESELKRASDAANAKHWEIAGDGKTVWRLGSQKLTLNAIAKGAILDALVSLIEQDFPKITGCMINIGGDLRVAGDMFEKVLIPHPQHDALNAAPWKRVMLSQAAIATSGNSERFYTLNGKRLSHILDPRSGMPVSKVVSATVVAPTAETADALATICCVVEPQEAIEIVEAIPGCSCCLMLEGEAEFCSANWHEEPQAGEEDREATPYEMNIEFEIAKPANSGRYRRPYVAVWIEDQDEYPVKTLSLFLMANNPGPRWHRDLRRWYASDQLRLLSDDTKLIGTISKPTRNPGSYKVAWNGKDDHDKVLKEGKYTLYIEAAREHGTYQLIKYPFELGPKAFKEELKGNVEIQSAKIQYSKKS
jgi:FAD:protein FMN transferase